jgi:hypothetical protein
MPGDDRPPKLARSCGRTSVGRDDAQWIIIQSLTLFLTP